MELPLKTNIDRFSNLPDNVIHDILSLLSMRDIARVCTLSRRLRQLCFSMPSLNITFEPPSNNTAIYAYRYTPMEERVMKERKLNNFTAYMERFWQLRSNNNNAADLLRLRIALLLHDLNDDMEYRIVTWIYNATMCRIQELHLDVAVKNTFCLPLFALNCTSLRVLKLDLHGCPLKLPNAQFNSLQDLSLKSFRALNPLLGEWISSYCKAITKLSLEHLFGMSNLNITSSSLQDVIINTVPDDLCHVKISAVHLRTLYVAWGFGGFPMSKSVTIFAPNLQVLKYVGRIAYFSCQGEFKSLEHASVIVTEWPREKAAIGSFMKFFCLLNKARKMELGGRFIKMLCNQDFAPPMPLENLWHLTIHDGRYKDRFRIPALASFLKSSPNLRYLGIRYNDTRRPTFVNYEQEGNLLPTQAYTECWKSTQQWFVQELEVVEIELSGEENEVELIKYLLKHAKSLKRMTIFYSLQDLSISKSVNFISKNVEAFAKTCSTAGVYFLPCQWQTQKKNNVWSSVNFFDF